MMDEFNDKTNKSCIILIHVFDSCVGDVRTKFLDMPIVNIGSAKQVIIRNTTVFSGIVGSYKDNYG